MKKMIFVAFSVVMLAFAGCKSEKVIIVDPSPSTNSVQKTSTGFADEDYVWENWFFSSEKVKGTRE